MPEGSPWKGLGQVGLQKLTTFDHICLHTRTKLFALVDIEYEHWEHDFRHEAESNCPTVVLQVSAEE